MPMINYSFLVLSYNHEKYIIEHLESIKYQVEYFGSDKKIKLIVNDDASKDNSVFLIEKWLEKNKCFFEQVVILKNEKNIGTCHSVTNMISHVGESFFKITAGDDVYSCENIFELMDLSKDIDIVSGFPLYLFAQDIYIDKFIIKCMIASNLIYAGKSLLHRFKSITFDNAPNACYKKEYFKSNSTIDFLNMFDVTEDWPIQISIARANASAESSLLEKCFVLYRRTEGSTYLVASSRFVIDKNKIYKNLINDSSFFEKIFLKNRRFAFNFGKYGRFFNISLYIFFVKYLCNIKVINNRFREVNINMVKINSHYALIKKRSKSYEV